MNFVHELWGRRIEECVLSLHRFPFVPRGLASGAVAAAFTP